MLCKANDGDEEMIVVDIETSGVDMVRCGIWQIGATDFENPNRQFLEEAKIDDSDIIIPEALIVIGKTEVELRDKKKQTQKQLIENFFKWCEKVKFKNLICQNPQFDFSFLAIKASKYGLKLPFHYRSFDLHSVASQKYLQVNRKLLIADGHSDMGLGNILHFCGMKDTRMKMEKGQVIRKGSPHNALEDAKLTAECFSRIMYGKNLLSEFKKFSVPKYLK